MDGWLVDIVVDGWICWLDRCCSLSREVSCCMYVRSVVRLARLFSSHLPIRSPELTVHVNVMWAEQLGGCNTVVDALYVGQALVNWEGPRWNGRIGSAIVRRVSPSFAEQVVATSHQQYVNMTVRALTDPATRISLKRQALQADMDSLFGLSSPESVPREEDDFVEAVNYLIQNHQQKSKPRIILMSEVAKGTTTSQKRKEEL